VSRYRFIEVEKVNHAVRTLCRVLQVSRTAYYHWSIHPLSARARADLVLTERIAAIHTRSRQTYGAPRAVRTSRCRRWVEWVVFGEIGYRDAEGMGEFRRVGQTQIDIAALGPRQPTLGTTHQMCECGLS